MAGRTSKSKNFETKVQLDLSEYIKDKYPDIIFTSESSGIKLTMGQSMVAKRCRSSRGLPDMWVMQPKKGYNGCFLELKKEDVKIFKKDGFYISNDHIREQEEVQYRLRQKGYYCEFAVGLNEAKKILDWYLS
tara:strand:- start:174 stop:572 length:399 start_codon:yes stop_codon:yes gene_type:complete